MAHPWTKSLIAAGALQLVACQAQPAHDPPSRAPAATALGEARSCVQTNLIRQTHVHDDRTIDFHMINGEVYRNTLPNRCPQLGFEERFSYRTTTSQLCNVDIIYVLYSDGRQGAGCGLGAFVPVRLERDAR